MQLRKLKDVLEDFQINYQDLSKVKEADDIARTPLVFTWNDSFFNPWTTNALTT